MTVFNDSLSRLAEVVGPVTEIHRTKECALVAVHLAPGEAREIEPKDRDRVVTVAGGDGSYGVGTDRHPARAGDVVLVPRDTAIEFTAGAEPIGLVVVIVGPPASPGARPQVWAEPGDHLVVHGRTVGKPDRDGEVIQTAAAGLPPFTVRWSDSGRLSMFIPGSGVSVHHSGHPEGGRP